MVMKFLAIKKQKCNKNFETYTVVENYILLAAEIFLYFK